MWSTRSQWPSPWHSWSVACAIAFANIRPWDELVAPAWAAVEGEHRAASWVAHLDPCEVPALR